MTKSTRDMHWFEILVEVPSGVSPETVYAVLYANGSTGCAEEGGYIRAYFGPDADLSLVVRELEAAGSRVVSTTRIDDTDWTAGWKETIGPYRAYGFLICPPWKSDECVAGSGETRIIIDPGEAFGEGGHPTTSSVLGLMRKWAEERDVLNGCSLLDVGTGTGILSVAGCALGFGHVRAVDTEPKAVETARINISHNGAGERVELSLGGIDTVKGDYDLIVANVFLEPLMDIIPAAARMLLSGGWLIVSGVLTGQFPDVLGCADDAGLRLIERIDTEGWVSGSFVRQ